MQYQPHRRKGAPAVGAVAVGQRGPYGVREEFGACDVVAARPQEGSAASGEVSVADQFDAEAPHSGVRI